MRVAATLLGLLVRSLPTHAQDSGIAGSIDFSPPRLAAAEGVAAREPDPAAEPGGFPGPAARDPFAFTPLLLPGTAGGFISGDPSALPPLKIRAIARVDGQAVVLLEIGSAGVFLLRENETVTLREAAAPLTLRVRAINSHSVEVESGALQQVVVR